MRERTNQQIYQKKTQLQHILIRPDTYVGSTQIEKSYKWILRSDNLKFTNEQITYVPALYKIFDEVLVNAADNYHRDHRMNLLKVEINQEQGYVSVHNNGKGIPVEIHKEQKIYIPEMIFGHLLTGSNYNDDEKKVVGGRNGYGAKLANIFSHRFVLECGDGKGRKKFSMTWRKNMTIHGEPEISPYTGKDYTKVTFYPEFKRFGMEAFDDDIVSLMRKRVYDMAGLIPRVKVFLGDRELEINSFLKYVDMYLHSGEEVIKIRDQQVDNERWQIVVSLSEGEFRQVSFVNSICTSKGGTHVNYIVDQIVERVQERIAKKDKKLIKVKPFQIKAHLWVFINCLVENPAFDSQTKENMTLKVSLFGSTCQLSEKMIKDILKTGMVDSIIEEVNLKERQKLNKLTGGGKKSKLTGIPKLEDANEAGTRNSQQCTLILTQGDSAKSLAMAGIEIVGRDFYGVFPLKGKLLNVRQASNQVLMKNQEIQNVTKIVGLQMGKSYEDTRSLRYGSVMIMSDQDTDGSHIKGLVVNFIHFFWPSLFRMRGFLKQFITPLLKVSKGRETHSFYILSDFKRWAQDIENLKSWKVKYYKGLGTSSDKEGQQYFRAIDRNRIQFAYQGRPDDDAIDLVFNKKKAQQRKEWLSTYDPNSVMDYNSPTISYHQFINKQFIHFSNEDNQRSIGSIIDGFKPGQRKIIYACFKRNLKEEIKVAQLAGYVSEHSAYHHGEISLTMTIVNMAQNFVGSNNINLLMPNGQFGSRNQGGKDHASARYIFTNLNKITRFIFPEADDHTLNYLEDDGQMVEPEYYMPIIPMALVNGCDGIGSGWSTNVPNFNHRQIASMFKNKLENDQELTEIKPWFKGFSGEVNPKEDGNYEMKGMFHFDEDRDGVLHIQELTVGKWTKDYKEYLQKIMEEGPTKIVSMREYHTKNRVHFELELNEEYYRKYRNDTAHFQKFLKLTSSISLKNMVGFNSSKRLFRYPSVKFILDEFYDMRLGFYIKRKEYLVSKLQRDMELLSNKERFILEIVEEAIVLRNVKKTKIIEILKQRGYTRFSDFTKVKSTKGQIKKEAVEGEEEENEGNDTTDYNYLLSMPLWNLSYEKVEDIKKQCREKGIELEVLNKTTIKEMWLADLSAFLEVLDKYEAEEQEERKKNQDIARKEAKGQKAKKVGKKGDKEKAKGNKKKGFDWDEDSEAEDKKPKVKKEQKVSRQVKGQKQQKIVRGKTKEENEPNDLMSRVKKKLQQSQANSSKLKVVAKLQEPKQMTLGNFVKANEQGSKANMVMVARSSVSKSGTKAKKKMNLDSDEDEFEETQDYEGEAEWDESD